MMAHQTLLLEDCCPDLAHDLAPLLGPDLPHGLTPDLVQDLAPYLADYLAQYLAFDSVHYLAPHLPPGPVRYPPALHFYPNYLKKNSPKVQFDVKGID